MDPIIRIGAEAPNFRLLDLKGKEHTLADFLNKIVILVFWSAECDWCERVDKELMTYDSRWKDEVKVLWAASNANESLDLIERVAAERGLSTVLVDAHQELANAYGARTTPHIFIVDGNGRLAYQGAWNDITLRQKAATKVYATMVVEALMAGRQPPVTQTTPYGCVLVRYAV